MKIFCVLPAFNEAEHIVEAIRGAWPFVQGLIVVDDGSTDCTAALARSAGATVLTHLINRGQGAALRTGTEYALRHGAGVIVHFDADGQFLGPDIAAVAEPIVSGRAQAVFGSRFLSKTDAGQMPQLKRWLIMPLARAVNRWFFNVKLTDPQSGFRALSATAARRVNWSQDGMAHCSEIMLAVKKLDLAMEEVPISVIYRDFGQSFWAGVKILQELFFSLLLE